MNWASIPLLARMGAPASNAKPPAPARSDACAMSAWSIVLLALLWPHAPAVARTQRDLANPAHVQCIGKNRLSGNVEAPIESYGDPAGRAYAVIYFHPALGTAHIIYGPRYRTIAPLLQSFITRHECQHANGVQDEIVANCLALTQMRSLGLTLEQETQIASWHRAEGTIDPRYGGSGAAFWELTLACAGARSTAR